MTAKPAKPKTRIVYKSSITGRFVSKTYVDANRDTTQAHRIKPAPACAAKRGKP